VDRCSGCGFEIAAHYLFEQRSMRVAKLKDENPIEAIELLELMVRSGAGEKEAAMAKDLRQKQGKIGPWMTQARERLLAGQPEEAVGLWRDILRLVPRHRAALAEVERLECLIAQCLALRDQAAEAMNEARFDDAQVRLQKCLELIPQHPEVATQLAGARERAIQYASLRTDVSAARKEKKLRLALDLAARLLSLAPRSPEALSESQDIHELLEQTEGLIADGKKRLARAQFVEAQETIRKVELLQADHPDVAELTRSLARSRTEYDQAMAEAEQARENRDLDRAANALRQAHDLCPACSRVNDLLKAVCEGQQRACDLLRAVEDAINAAQFEVGERHLKEAEDIHPRVRGAAEARQRLAATRCEYDQYMQRGQQAMAGRDLNVALDSSQKALVLCPGSERARNLFEQVQGDQAAARRHLQGIRALCEAAEFDAAAKKVSAARALWSTLEGVDDSEAEMLSRRRAYQQEMEKIHRLRGGKKLQEAFEACAVALKVCPKSREVESLRDAILQEGRCEAERQAHRSRQWAGRRRLLLRLTKALVLIAAVLAVLAALGVGGMHLWRGLCAMAGRGVHAVQGSDVHMMALRWCPQQIFIVGIVDWVLLCVVARIHKARYTNLYHHIFQGLFNGARDQQMRAAGVVALWLAIVCGGTPAAIAWLCVHYEKFTFGQAASFTVLGTGVLAFLALILALVRRCRWRLA
jgi:tetratricopeptide (TPR) repeat protein